MKLDGNLIMVQNARCSYPNLTMPTRPKAYPNSAPMFSLDLIIPVNDVVVGETMAVIGLLAQDKWKGNAANIMQAITSDKKARSYHNGEEMMDKNFQRKSDIYPDGTFIVTTKAKEEEPPVMINQSGTSIDKLRTNDAWMEIAKSIYAGCRVNAIFRPWLRLANPGVSFTLVAVQFAKDDEKFASVSSPDVSGMFGAVAGPTPVMGSFIPPAGLPDFMK